MAERSLTFGSFRLDLLQNRLWREAQPVALRPQAFAVLCYLVLHADRLVTKAHYRRTCGTDGRWRNRCCGAVFTPFAWR